MNAKQVLSKVAKLLNLEEEVTLTYAKLADGTIVESATFDVGEDLFVVSEDGTKTPAPNGTHELMLKDTEGNETLLKVITEDGKIVERENVELAEVETKETEKLPGGGFRVYIDQGLAPHAKYTNESWSRGKNPNEDWFDDAGKLVARAVASTLGSTPSNK